MLKREKWQSHAIVSLLDMLRHYASDYVYILKLLDSCKDEIYFDPVWPQEQRVARFSDAEQLIKDISGTVLRMDMPLSVIQCDRAIAIIKGALSQNDAGLQLELLKELPKRIDTVCEIILDELNSRMFYFVNPELAEYYDKNQFSSEVTHRFTDAVYDMEEAGKCFSLGRHTACAFHLMRVVECGLLELKDFLTIDKHCPSWDSILNAIKKHISSSADKTERDKYEEIVARVYTIKDVWRNNTMHVDYK
ncbi:MAG: hypothetical protein NT028_14795, partial [candidate division Zixibacteria bacterium]|nr:hypothetical protein [candidate division Zixibacteria bacterium]